MSSSLPPHIQAADTDEAPAPASASGSASGRPWHRTIPGPTWVTAIFAVLPLVVSFNIQNMRTVNGEVVEFFRFDVFQAIAAAVLVLAFVAVLLRLRKSSAPDLRPPTWAVAVGAVGAVLAVYFALTAHTGLDGLTAVLAAR
ncbi:hypothetical protein [Georgenia sp. Z1491]|uniref:hypothetical protein n=1 Tax=Georgenia sp. Z1491 TaxID=3416707 RepID=UPI003CECC801